MTRTDMTCRETVIRLLDYLEGRLQTGESRALEDHLDVCPRCMQFLEAYRRTPEIVRRCTDAKAQPALTKRLRRIFAK